jgi:hypothetical protein
MHPEFGYAVTFNFLRPFTAFVVCGLVAGAIGFAIFASGPDPDPMDAMALAPAEPLIAQKLVQPATQSEKGLANRPSAQKADEEGANASRKASSIKPTCRESLGEVRQGDCTPVRVVRMRPPRAVNERPLIAAVPIGHRDDPTMLPASPQTRIGVGPLPTDPPEEPKATPPPTQLSVAEEIAPDAAPAGEPTPPVSIPTVTSKKPRPRVHHASHRHNQYSYTSSYSARKTYVQAGYARLW